MTRRLVIKAPKKRRARKSSSRVLDAVALGVDKEYLITPPLTPPQRGGEETKKFHRPLVSPRTSFWLGVGFGVFVVGALAAIAWQLLRVGAVEAVVMGMVK